MKNFDNRLLPKYTKLFFLIPIFILNNYKTKKKILFIRIHSSVESNNHDTWLNNASTCVGLLSSIVGRYQRGSSTNVSHNSYPLPFYDE